MSSYKNKINIIIVIKHIAYSLEVEQTNNFAYLYFYIMIVVNSTYCIFIFLNVFNVFHIRIIILSSLFFIIIKRIAYSPEVQ